MSDTPGFVYLLYNDETGQGYVGSTVNDKRRGQDHHRLLAKGSHHSYLLQRAFAENPNFQMFSVPTADREEALVAEQALLNLHWGNPFLLNVASNVENPTIGRVIPEEESIRRREAARRVTESTEGRARLARMHEMTRGSKQPPEWTERRLASRAGYSPTEETRRKISESNKGKKKSESSIQAQREAMTGRTLTPDHKAKVLIGLEKSREVRCTPVRVADVVYPSLTAAAQAHEISKRAALYRIQTPNFPEWERVSKD